jgi:hypothetical protein
MKAEVVFTEDFATKKKGDNWLCDKQIASQLVNVDKVAKYKETEKVKKEPKPKE